MSNTEITWLVVTDLDGTLLNHHDYSFNHAIDAIALLKQKKIPVIFNTSKTYNESISIRKALSINDPFIVENGSAIYLPQDQFTQPDTLHQKRDSYWEVTTGVSRSTINQLIKSFEIPTSHYTLLSECTAEQAMALTGLNKEQANQAIARDFSEPFIWHGNEQDMTQFTQRLHDNQLNLLEGGRFYHALGQCNKGQATTRLNSFYAGEVKTIILGDSANDADMLSIADISAMIKSPSNHKLSPLVNIDITSSEPAPAGWAEAIKYAIKLIPDQEQL